MSRAFQIISKIGKPCVMLNRSHWEYVLLMIKNDELPMENKNKLIFELFHYMYLIAFLFSLLQMNHCNLLLWTIVFQYKCKVALICKSMTHVWSSTQGHHGHFLAATSTVCRCCYFLIQARSRPWGARDLSRDNWIKEFIKQKWSFGLFWAVGATVKKKSQLP